MDNDEVELMKEAKLALKGGTEEKLLPYFSLIFYKCRDLCGSTIFYNISTLATNNLNTVQRNNPDYSPEFNLTYRYEEDKDIFIRSLDYMWGRKEEWDLYNNKRKNRLGGLARGKINPVVYYDYAEKDFSVKDLERRELHDLGQEYSNYLDGLLGISRDTPRLKSDDVVPGDTPRLKSDDVVPGDTPRIESDDVVPGDTPCIKSDDVVRITGDEGEVNKVTRSTRENISKTGELCPEIPDMFFLLMSISINFNGRLPNKERDIEDFLCHALGIKIKGGLDEYGNGRQVPVPVAGGIADIVFGRRVIELKTASKWGSAIQQLTRYSRGFPDYDLILIVFNRYEDNTDAEIVCKKLGVRYLAFEDLLGNFLECALGQMTKEFILG